MPGKPKMTVSEYLKQLKETKKGKPPQIRDALDIYIELWEKVVERKIISDDEEIEAALSKIDKAGGLYQASG
ncbi:MAG: hypothetical protein OK455_05880 [Thaumarchaeota archaeon]|nr:hypothetical protein [Nitrososphaerota archaeon]